jgi:hypothetical protein
MTNAQMTKRTPGNRKRCGGGAFVSSLVIGTFVIHSSLRISSFEFMQEASSFALRIFP